MQKIEYARLPLLGFALLGSGAALVVAILWRISLGLALIVFAAALTGIVALQVSRLPVVMRRGVRVQAGRGALIGFAATLAYDLTRLLLVVLFPLRVRPFETWVRFGYAILDASASRDAALIVGTIYHYANGVFFAVSYGLLLGRRAWGYGVAWAFGLEVAMLVVYPRWLNLRDVLAEFTLISLVGHLAYGVTLGALGQRLLSHALPRSKASL